MTELVHRALMGDKKSQEECTEKGIIIPCIHCGGKGKVSFKDYRFIGQNYFGDKKIVYRVQVICNKCRSRGKPIFTKPLINPNPYITKWGNSYAETDICNKETQIFYPYVKTAINEWNTIYYPPIGRCIECKYRGIKDKSMCDHPVSGLFDMITDDDFCSYFELKDRE